MHISKVYLEKGYDLVAYNPEDISLAQIKTDTDIASVYTVEVDLDDNGLNLTTVNLSILLTLFDAGQSTTWLEFKDTLTPAIIEAYHRPIPNLMNPTKAVRAISPLTSPDFDLSYTTVSVPEERNIKQFRYRLTDLGIKKTNPENKFNLNNCLCFVNGLTSRPVIHNGEFLMKNGAKFMASTSETRHPSTVLLDFSELGGFEIIPFSACQKKFKNYTDLPDSQTDIKIIFPGDIDLFDYTIFTVIGHTLFFPDRIGYLTSKSILIKPDLFRVEMSLLKQQAASNAFLEHTHIFKTETSVAEYILSTMFDPNHYGAFFVMIKNRKLLFSRTKINNFCKSVENTLGTDGFVYDRTTQSFLDYTEVGYDSVNDLYLNPLHGILHLDSQNPTGIQYALNTSKCNHVDTFRDYGLGGFEFIKLIGN